MIRVLVQILLVALVLTAGVLGARKLVSMRPAPVVTPPEIIRPLVRVAEARSGPVEIEVHSQGTVVPRTESRMVSEVSGRVLSLNPSLANGGFFAEHELLITLDASDYRLALAQARLQLAQAESRRVIEEADAEVAREDWERLGEGSPGPLVLHVPQLAEAEAAVAAAQAAIDKAQLDVERCEVRAPYAGRVRSKAVDVGQYVSRGAELARVYAVDYAEVRVPLANEELAFLDLPLAFRDEDAPASGAEVRLHARFAGRDFSWQGRVVRTEGELDPRSRMLYAVVRVEDPYGRSEELDRPPLALGMFVDVTIVGHRFEDIISLPRIALRGSGEVLVVDADERLEIRPVEVLRAERERVLLLSGLEAGERIIVSPLEVAVEGMAVRVVAPEENGAESVAERAADNASEGS